MKTTKRGKLLMLACAALVAVLACLPLLWFRAQDARMFGTVNQSSGLYESREVSGDDFYLLQQVKNRTQMNRTDWMVSAGLDGTAALYTPAGNSRYNMTSSDTATDFAASLLTQLHDAEVLPDTWYHVAADNLSSYSSGELYTSSDSLGITRLLRYPHAAYDESDPEYNESPTFALDYDNKTGRLLNLWVQAPLDSSLYFGPAIRISRKEPREIFWNCFWTERGVVTTAKSTSPLSREAIACGVEWLEILSLTCG